MMSLTMPRIDIYKSKHMFPNQFMGFCVGGMFCNNFHEETSFLSAFVHFSHLLIRIKRNYMAKVLFMHVWKIVLFYYTAYYSWPWYSCLNFYHFKREKTFVSFCRLSCAPIPLWKGAYSKRKEFAPKRSKFFLFRVDLFSERDKTILA